MSGIIAPAGLERRAVSIELRAVSGRRLQGYAATFGTPAQIGSFREVIQSGAFKRSLNGGSDILLLADHDPKRVLARTAAGNLTLAEDGRGLAFEATLPNTTAANDVLALVESRTAGGMSFGFLVPTNGDSWSGDTRTLRDVDLLEISVVSAFPAYSGTEVAARARGITLAQARQRFLETL
jgi:Escherichia/Staphylococcus phage prohead protease